ncbi:hypothetical protein IG631_14785 [Alternaria alternata]|nr:hypothetical protein IG631_14785 [Alternaria alternata]
MARCMHGLGASCMTKAGPDLACEDMGSMTPVSRDAGPIIPVGYARNELWSRIARPSPTANSAHSRASSSMQHLVISSL